MWYASAAPSDNGARADCRLRRASVPPAAWSLEKVQERSRKGLSLLFPHDAFGKELHLLANRLDSLPEGWTLNGPEGCKAKVDGLEPHDELRQIDVNAMYPASLEDGEEGLELPTSLLLH